MSEVIDQDQQGVKATPETIAKLEPDWFLSLFAESRLDKKDPEMNARMFDAGVEIRRAFDAIVSPVSLKCHDYEKEVRRSHWEVAESHADQLLKIDRMKRRYVEWADAMTARKLPVGVVIAIVKDGLSLQQCDRSFRKSTNYSGKVLREGLRLYCEIAGWVRSRAA